MNEDTMNQEENQTPEFHQGSFPGGRIEYRPETAFRGSAALFVQADRAEVTNGACIAAVASEVNINKGGSLVTVGKEVEIEKGYSEWVIAGEAELEQAGAAIVIAREVEATDVKVGILLAANVNGNVQAIMDRDAALRLGLGLGAVLGFVLLIRRLLR